VETQISQVRIEIDSPVSQRFSREAPGLRRRQFIIAGLVKCLSGILSFAHDQAPWPIGVFASAGALPGGMRAQIIRFLEANGRDE
jgi:hypothetical protein